MHVGCIDYSLLMVIYVASFVFIITMAPILCLPDPGMISMICDINRSSRSSLGCMLSCRTFCHALKLQFHAICRPTIDAQQSRLSPTSRLTAAWELGAPTRSRTHHYISSEHSEAEAIPNHRHASPLPYVHLQRQS